MCVHLIQEAKTDETGKRNRQTHNRDFNTLLSIIYEQEENISMDIEYLKNIIKQHQLTEKQNI